MASTTITGVRMARGAPPDLRVERARRGDVEAFTELLREHDDAMRALVFSMVRDRWVMDDILQNAYEKAYRSLAAFRGEASFKTWLHRICWSTAIDMLRHEGLRRHDDVADHEDAARSGPGESTGAVVRVTLDGALARLPEQQRTAVVMVIVNGMTYDEAATAVGATAGTIASRVSRGREALRALIGATDEGARR